MRFVHLEFTEIAQLGHQLAHGIALVRRGDRGAGFVHLGGKPAQTFDDQLVLRFQMAIERHLVGAGGLGNGVDADLVKAVAIEKVTRHRDNPFPRGTVGRPGRRVDQPKAPAFPVPS